MANRTEVRTIDEAQKRLFVNKVSINVVRLLADNAGYYAERLNKFAAPYNQIGLRKGRYLKEFKTTKDAAVWLEKTLDPTQL